MAVTYDAVSSSGEENDDLSWTHSPIGVPKGIIVFVTQRGNSNDQISAVTYGSLAMSRVTYTVDTAGEQSATHAYFVGASIPTGGQTVAIGTTDQTRRVAVAVSLTANSDTTVNTSDTTGENQENPAVTLATGAGVECFCAGALHYGKTGSGTPQLGYTVLYEHDYGIGSESASFIRRTSNSTGGDVSLGWTASTDDVSAVGLAITEEGPPGVVSRALQHVLSLDENQARDFWGDRQL
jgi:hypothetical protein